ncbi:beta-2-glycoprotein 1-like [Trichomycterus rosablanca]|uniref:beta-2-glycoprotein 1-like n=1 Tax=Trichomycterus rosablanca TaxID=2290929 RepID=UPI002F350713
MQTLSIGMRSILQLLLLCLAFVAVTQSSVCPRPPQEKGSELNGGHMFFEPGTEVTLSCMQGFTSSGGSRKITCKKNGHWTERELKCSPRRCPVPDSPENGKANISGIVYESVITYSCNEGFILYGANSSECLQTGKWSKPKPQCQSVTCNLPDIPQFAKIVYDKLFKDDTVEFGSGGTYHCLPPMVLVGNKRAICQADGKWTEPPECKLVTCPPPVPIDNGFLSFAENREHGYREKVRYGCMETYILDGSLEVECADTGLWDTLPTCRAPCKVDIERGRVVYKNRKYWIEDFKHNVLHGEEVIVYCLNKQKKCGYPVTMQCNDGVMNTPNCYDEPSAVTYNVRSGSLPSEIDKCT